MKVVLVWLDMISTSPYEFYVTKVSAVDIKRHITHETHKKQQKTTKNKKPTFTTSAKSAACTTKKIKATGANECQ